MVRDPRRAYLVAGAELEHDMGREALVALEKSEFNVVLSAYRNATTDRAHVILPIAPFTETPGTFVSMEGRVQSFNAVVKAQGDSRPGWKVLRMLGALLEITDFHPDTIEAVRAQIAPDLQVWATKGLGNAVATFQWQLRTPATAMERVAEFPWTASDSIARRSLSLQKSAEGKASRTARMNAATAQKLGVAAGGFVLVRQGGGEVTLAVSLDAALPDGAVRVARGVPETAALGEGELTVEKARETAAA